MPPSETNDLALALAELAASASDHNNDQLVPSGERPCPICGIHMDTLDQYHITIDVCADHGVWLDQGEFANILERAYLYRREGEVHPHRNRAEIQAETRAKYKAGLNRVASMISLG